MSTTTTTDLRTAVDAIFDHMAKGEILEAIDAFYDENVAMQENSGEPTIGRAANVEREKQFLASIKEWKSLDIHSVGLDGDTNSGTALIEYSFDFINTDNQPVRYEQVAVQTWQNGRITRERFYYNAGG